MGAPSLRLSAYTLPFDIDRQIHVRFENDDGRVRSVELEAIDGVPSTCYLTLEGDDVLLNVSAIPSSESKSYEKIALRFVIGYLDLTDEELATYTEDDLDESDDEIVYQRVDVNLYATKYDEDPYITYVENLASRVDEAVSVVVHGTNMTDGLSIKLTNGEDEYIVPPEDIEFDIDEDGVGTATFTVYPGMLATDGNGSEPCAQYNIYFSYGDQQFGDPNISLIRYKYDTENDELQRYSTEGVTIEKECYKTGSMSLVYDSVDENGNAVKDAASNPRLGDNIVLHMDSFNVEDVVDHFDEPVDRYGLKFELSDGRKVELNEYDLVELNDQTNHYDNGYWLAKKGAWRHVHNCDEYTYVMVRLKYNKNLSHKHGELKLGGVQLVSGDVVWLARQTIETENGLWVVQEGDWLGYGDEATGCGIDCYRAPLPKPVDDSVLIDLGAKATYQVDYVCRDDVPYKCGSRTICNYRVSPGNVVALLNATEGTGGIYLVTCGDWVKLYDITEDEVNGTTVDLSRYVVVQNNIEFCKCGGIFYIDYYFLTPTCYMQHLRRTVKILCGKASIAPNAEGSQFRITEYQIRVGEEEALIGNNGRTPGDPVKETCVVDTEDFEYDFGLTLVEHRQYIENPPCITTPMCNKICDVPRIYNLRMPAGYSNSNDRNGFTIKFWRLEEDGWHLYAYVASGTQMTGMDYYVYHLHVKGKATEAMVDVNEHDWFSETTGVIASGDGQEAFGLYDERWEFADGTHSLRSETLYQPWRITCTTNLLAQCTDYDKRLRLTCADMEVGWKTVQAIGDEETPGYLSGMPHLFGVAYYTTTMSKSQFVAEYNQYDPNCIWYSINEVLVTDEDGEAYTYDGNPIHTPIETDDSDETHHKALRR